MRTLLLDTKLWDLVTDINGNIAVAEAPYQLAQDAASAIRLFKGELYYDTTQGQPYWQQILGQIPPIALIKRKFLDAALSVPGVVSARVFVLAWDDRTISGQVQVADKSGVISTASF